MAQMNVSIPRQMKSWCDAQVKSGRYSTASDYVRDLIRRDQDDREGHSKVQAMIDDAIASGISPHSLDEVFALAKEKARALSRNAD